MLSYRLKYGIIEFAIIYNTPLMIYYEQLLFYNNIRNSKEINLRLELYNRFNLK